MVRRARKVWAAVAIVVAACGRSPLTPEDLAHPRVVLQAPAGVVQQIANVTVRVSGPGMSPLSTTLTIQGNQASGTLRVPAGPDRTFTVEAKNTQGTVVATGSRTQSLEAGSSPTVSIALSWVPAQVSVSVSLNTAQGVASVLVRVSASDISPITQNLSLQGTQATGTVSVPPGAARTFAVEAKDAAGTTLASATRTVSLEPAQSLSLQFSLSISAQVELAFDDGNPGSSYRLDPSIGWVAAGVRLTAPSYPVKVLTLKVYVAEPGGGFWIGLADFAGTPSLNWLGQPTWVTCTGTGWGELDVSGMNLTVSRDFLVVVACDASVQSGSFGADNADNGRAWDLWAGPQGEEWRRWNETYFMRAVVRLGGGQLAEVGPSGWIEGDAPRAAGAFALLHPPRLPAPRGAIHPGP